MTEEPTGYNMEMVREILQASGPEGPFPGVLGTGYIPGIQGEMFWRCIDRLCELGLLARRPSGIVTRGGSGDPRSTESASYHALPDGEKWVSAAQNDAQWQRAATELNELLEGKRLERSEPDPMINPMAAAQTLEEFAARYDRAGVEVWKGILNPAAEETAALRELAGRLRDSTSSATTLHRSDAALLNRLATQIRFHNEALVADDQVSPDWKRNAEMGLAVAKQLEELAEWILSGLGGH